VSQSAGVTEPGAAQNVPVVVGTAVSGEPVALMAAVQPLMAAAAGQTGGRRLAALWRTCRKPYCSMLLSFVIHL
jgi:hypothetical protein